MAAEGHRAASLHLRQVPRRGRQARSPGPRLLGQPGPARGAGAVGERRACGPDPRRDGPTRRQRSRAVAGAVLLGARPRPAVPRHPRPAQQRLAGPGADRAAPARQRRARRSAPAARGLSGGGEDVPRQAHPLRTAGLPGEAAAAARGVVPRPVRGARGGGARRGVRRGRLARRPAAGRLRVRRRPAARDRRRGRRRRRQGDGRHAGPAPAEPPAAPSASARVWPRECQALAARVQGLGPASARTWSPFPDSRAATT